VTATLEPTLSHSPRRRPAGEPHHSPGTGRRIALPSALVALLGLLSLAGLVAGSLFVVLAAAERRSFLSPPSHAGFPRWMSGPLAGLLPSLTHDLHGLKVAFTVAVAGMFALYLIVLLCVRAVPTWAVLGAIVAVHLAFFLSPPLPLTDLFNYLNYARMGAVHGLNPYVHVPVLARHDPAYRFTTWHHLRSPYGPLFTLAIYPLAVLPLATAYWAFKAAVMGASLGCLALVWKCARMLGRSPRAAVAFVGLNPLFVVYGLGGQHNDVFMMLLVLTAVYLLLRLREVVGGAAIAAAVAVKASAGVLLPIVLLGARRRGRALAGALVGGAVAVTVALAVFGPHLPNDGSQSKLVVPFGLANLLGLALGLGGVTSGLRTALELVLAAGVVAACVVAWRARRDEADRGRRDWLPVAAAVSLLLVLTLTWVMPWYVYWVLPLAALARGRALRVAVVVVGISLLVTWLPLSLDFAHKSLHIYPTRTSVGKQNSAYLHRLLH
jgi:hypothetical protein